MCLPAQSPEHGGDSRRQAVTLGELDRAVQGPKPISRTDICCFVQGGTGCALPEPYRMTSSRPLCHGYGEDPSAAQEDGMSCVATEPSR